MHVFYQPDIQARVIYLSEEESKHCVKVLRLQARDEAIVVDGKGGYYRTEIVRPDAKRCELRIVEQEIPFGKRDFSIHIAIAPTKSPDRIEWFVEKSVEIGIDEISFLICDHSERRFFKKDRVEKIAIGAMKQSLKAFLPHIHEATLFSDFLSRADSQSQNFVAYVDENTPKEQRFPLQSLARPQGNYCVLIGPEGDFSSSEIKQALAAGFRPVSLGESRLRTETAGVVACHILHLIHHFPSIPS